MKLNRQELKNALRGQTCDLCIYRQIAIPPESNKYECKNNLNSDELPKSNTCDHWKSYDFTTANSGWVSPALEHAKAVADKLKKFR